MVTRLPRLVITAPGSGHGKTTVASGLMAALRAEGLEVAGFKVGPDYIDPGYHLLATGRPGRNLDPHLCHEDQLVPLLLHGAAVPAPADLAVIEGVMGLFDGQIGGDGYASTAHVATLTQSPIVAVIDISQSSRTIAAVVHGLATFEPGLRLAGVILNKAGSARHAGEVVSALEATGVPVLGTLPRNAGIEAPSRHLGLVPAAERADAEQALAVLAGQITEHIDLTAVLKIAYGATDLEGPAWDPTEVVKSEGSGSGRPVVAIAGGRAFTFRYAEVDELLRAAGCEPVIFDPLHDQQLPAGTAGIYLGGGFPEVHASELSANTGLLAEVRAAVDSGMPVVAECAGLLYLCETVDGSTMVGAIPADAAMTGKLTLSYRSAVADHDHLLAVAGTRVTGHEFHRTQITARSPSPHGWLLDGSPDGFTLDPAGTGSPTVHASYLHTHWAGHPHLAQHFANAVHTFSAFLRENVLLTPIRRSSRARTPIVRPPASPEPDLHHHGDRDIADGLVDLAVNVRLRRPPEWVAATIRATLDDLASYPRADEARAAIAEAHGVPEEQVLPTSGGAEAFTLLARAIRSQRPVVVHPQFTEPEAALLAAGHHPQRVINSAKNGFVLDPEAIPPAADLIMIGNPTNPTSILHPAATIRSLLRTGRTVVVDEAFMDATPGETESLAGEGLPGLIIFRSLTKTWGLAGLRAGYAVGDPTLIAALQDQQPPWSVSTPALAAMIACVSPRGRAEAAQATVEIGARRNFLIDALTELGLPPIGPAAAPFVLVDTSLWRTAGARPGWLREALRTSGFAVRRGETFPGLGPDWIRIAVRDEATTQVLANALATLSP